MHTHRKPDGCPESKVFITGHRKIDALSRRCYEQSVLRISFATFLIALVSTACAPARSSAHLTDAQSQMETAKRLDAPVHATYEWETARLYLDKALEKAGYAEYDACIAYAQKASSWARKATERAKNTAQSIDLKTLEKK